ncbi:hypothetical protein TB2_033463 [Malus domestica]
MFHSYLISTNQSTYENFRYRYDGRENPFNKGTIKNFMEVFCTRISPSKNNFRAKVSKDPEVLRTPVDANFVSPVIGKAMSDIEMGRKPLWNDASGEMRDYEGQFINHDGVNKDPQVSEADRLCWSLGLHLRDRIASSIESINRYVFLLQSSDTIFISLKV